MYTNPLAFSNHIMTTTIIVPHPHLAIVTRTNHQNLPLLLLLLLLHLPNAFPLHHSAPAAPKLPFCSLPSLPDTRGQAVQAIQPCSSLEAVSLRVLRLPTVDGMGWDGMRWGLRARSRRRSR